MSRIVWIHGLAAGAVLALAMVAAFAFQDAIGFDRGAIVGYTSMVLAFSLIWFGVRAHRDENLGGRIGFARAFAVGALIALVATVCYVIAWQFVYHSMAPDFMERYTAYTLEGLRKSGAGDAAIAAKAKEMAEFAQLYRHPLVNIGFTALECLPVGLLFALVSAGLLRRPARAGAEAAVWT